MRRANIGIVSGRYLVVEGVDEIPVGSDVLEPVEGHTRAQSEAARRDSVLEAVGAINGTADEGRQGEGSGER